MAFVNPFGSASAASSSTPSSAAPQQQSTGFVNPFTKSPAVQTATSKPFQSLNETLDAQQTRADAANAPAAPVEQQSFLQQAQSTASNIGSGIASAAQSAGKAIQSFTAPIGQAVNNEIQNTPVVKNVFDTVINAQKGIDQTIGNGLFPNQTPVTPGYDPAYAAAHPELKLADPYGNESPPSPAAQKVLGALQAVTRQTGFALSGIFKGLTFGIVNPTTPPPKTPVEQTEYAAGQILGSLEGYGALGKSVGSFLGATEKVDEAGNVIAEGTGLLSKSKTITSFFQQYPTVERFAAPFITNLATFQIGSQIANEGQSRWKTAVSSTLAAFGFTALGDEAVSMPVKIPAMGALGVALAKLDGASNQDAVKSGIVLAALEAFGRPPGSTDMVTKGDVDPVIRQASINTLNKYLDEPLPSTATYEDAVAARRDLIKNGTYANTSAPGVTPEQIQTATEINNAINNLKVAVANPVPATQESAKPPEQQAKTQVYTPEELKTQTQTTDLQNTPAAERLDTIIASAQQTGSNLQVDMTGKSGIPVPTPGGNLIGVTLVQKGAATPESNNAVSQNPATQTQTGNQGAVSTPQSQSGSVAMETPTAGSTENQGIQGTQSNVSTPSNMTPEEGMQHLANYYASTDQNALGEAWYQVMAEMEVSAPGQKIFSPEGEYSRSISSTFPDFIPEELRTTKLFNSVMDGLKDPAHIQYPPNSQPRKQALYDAVLAEIDSRAGTDSSDIIQHIKDSYDKPKEISQQETPNALSSSTSGSQGSTEQSNSSNQVVTSSETPVAQSESSATIPTSDQSDLHKVSQNDIQESASRIAGGNSPATNGPKTADIAHTEGNSRFQERLKEQLIKTNGEHYNWDAVKGTYDKVNLSEDAQKAVDILQKDPERAMRIARGYETSGGSGALDASVANAMTLKAFDEGNAKLGTEIINRVSQTATRYGQFNASLRGNFNDNTPQNFIRQVIDARMEKLGNSIATDAAKTIGKERSAKTKAVEKIDREVEKLSKKMKAERAKITSAQDLLDSLTCK